MGNSFQTTNHRVSDGKDGYLRMLFSHQVDVIEYVRDVFVDRLDVNSVPVALAPGQVPRYSR